MGHKNSDKFSCHLRGSGTLELGTSGDKYLCIAVMPLPERNLARSHSGFPIAVVNSKKIGVEKSVENGHGSNDKNFMNDPTEQDHSSIDKALASEIEVLYLSGGRLGGSIDIWLMVKWLNIR